MNAVNSLARDLEHAKLDAAVERASKWVDTARPIIMAYFTLDDAGTVDLNKARFNDPTWAKPYIKRSPELRAWDEALGIVQQARDELLKMLDGVRDNYLCDERSVESPGGDATDQEWDAWEAFDEALEREVPSVDATIKLVEAEVYA